MTQTSFTMVGFTQPRAALPIIEDWFLPESIIFKLQDAMLTDMEAEQVRSYKKELGNILL